MSFRCFDCNETDGICLEDRPLFLMHANHMIYKCRLCSNFSVPFDFCKLSFFDNRFRNQRQNSEISPSRATRIAPNQVDARLFSGPAFEDIIPVVEQGFNQLSNCSFRARNIFNQNLQSAPVSNNVNFGSNAVGDQIKKYESTSPKWNLLKPEEYLAQINNAGQNFQRASSQHGILPFNAFTNIVRNGSGNVLAASSFPQESNTFNGPSGGGFQRNNGKKPEEDIVIDMDECEDMEEFQDPLLYADYKADVSPEDLAAFDENRNENEKVEEQVGQFRANNNSSKSIFGQESTIKKNKFK